MFFVTLCTSYAFLLFFFFSRRRRHTRFKCDWSSDVCSSDLPDDDLAGAVLAFRNGPLEGVVVGGVVLDMNGHGLDLGVERWTFWHRPAHHDAVHLQPEVVVQTGRPVFLDHKLQWIRRALCATRQLRSCAGGFGSLREIALGLVLCERFRDRKSTRLNSSHT